MEMCPYCGEDVPGESKRCWKCGTDLTGEAGDDDGGGGEMEPGRGDHAPAPVQTECPFCNAEIRPRALRCGECGRSLTKAARKSWIPIAYAAFSLAVLATLVGLIYAFISSRKPAEDPGRATPIPATYKQLIQMYGSNSVAAQRKKMGLWNKHHRGKFVEWEHYIFERSEDGTLGLTESPEGKRAQVVLVLKVDVEPQHLAKGKMITYTAALDRYEGKTLYLNKGMLKE